MSMQIARNTCVNLFIMLGVEMIQCRLSIHISLPNIIESSEYIINHFSSNQDLELAYLCVYSKAITWIFVKSEKYTVAKLLIAEMFFSFFAMLSILMMIFQFFLLVIVYLNDTFFWITHWYQQIFQIYVVEPNDEITVSAVVNWMPYGQP